MRNSVVWLERSPPLPPAADPLIDWPSLWPQLPSASKGWKQRSTVHWLIDWLKSVACSKLFFELSRMPTQWSIYIYHHMHICTNKCFSTQIICVATSYLSKMQFAKIQTVASKKSPFETHALTDELMVSQTIQFVFSLWSDSHSIWPSTIDGWMHPV